MARPYQGWWIAESHLAGEQRNATYCSQGSWGTDPQVQMTQNKTLTERRTETGRTQRTPCRCQQHHTDARHWKWSDSLVMYLLRGTSHSSWCDVTESGSSVHVSLTMQGLHDGGVGAEGKQACWNSVRRRGFSTELRFMERPLSILLLNLS